MESSPRPWSAEISFEQWKRAELVLLRGIARRCSAALVERDDPAMADNRPEILKLLAEWQAWRTYGLSRNWQP